MAKDDLLDLDLTHVPEGDTPLALDVGGGWKQVDVEQAIIGFKPAELPLVASPTATLPSVAEFTAVKLAEELGYTEMLTVGALEDGIRFYQQRAAEACFELGKRLLLLKELSGQGEFLARVDLLGIHKRSAQRFMSAARKFTKSDKMSLLVPKVSSQTKLLELLVLDDSDLQDLAEGGDAAGITLDEIECMTATELRKALRAHKSAVLPDEKAKPLTDRIASLETQIGYHEKHYAELDAKYEIADRKLRQLTAQRLPGKDNLSLVTTAVREEAYALEYGASTYIAALAALWDDAVREADGGEVQMRLRQDAVAVAVSGIYHGIDALYQTLAEQRGGEVAPELSGVHVLTEGERQRLADCKLMIDHDVKAKQAARELRRHEEARKPAGRPAGSGNKPK